MVVLHVDLETTKYTKYTKKTATVECDSFRVTSKNSSFVIHHSNGVSPTKSQRICEACESTACGGEATV